MPDLLLELGTEELPARFLDRLLDPTFERGLARVVKASLEEHRLTSASILTAGTPRRLAVWVGGLPDRQPDSTIVRWGPAKQAAFKDGKPTIAAQKFAESVGVAIAELEVREKPKGKKKKEHLYASVCHEGGAVLEVLAALIPEWIKALHFAKSMRWVSGDKLRFGRPLRSISALLGSEVVPATWAGVTAGRTITGHRFLERAPIVLADASWDDYREILRSKKVILDAAEREQIIRAELTKHMSAEDLTRHDRLVREVTNLVEWPEVDVGELQHRFLRLPDVVIVEAMTGHQRYFPISREGKLEPRFAYVANRPLHPVIRQGNERVLAARLSDALFFFDLDQKTLLIDRLGDLEPIVFMQGLGSYKDRIPRVAKLALEVARQAGWVPTDTQHVDVGTKITRSLPGGRLPVDIQRAAQLARADLTTEVVGEFPELQGQIGSIYAGMQGESEQVSAAIRESYLPRGEGDALPETQVGICLAVADKLDTIVSAWATGKKPKGSGDPFAVRRSTLGILRILRERHVELSLGRVLQVAVDMLPEALQRDDLHRELTDFVRDRLENQAIKVERRRTDLARAALRADADVTHIVDYWRRLEALERLAEDDRFLPLCELVERTRNITRKNGKDVAPEDVDTSRLEHEAEQALHEAVESCRDDVRNAIDEHRYADAGRAYTDALAEVTHRFFEPDPVGVFVMHDDLRLRTNRLALLKQVYALLTAGFADLAEVVKKKGK